MDTVRLYLRYLGASVRGQMQYRGSFFLASLGQLLATGIDFLALWALFARFGSLHGWRLVDVALLYGIVNVSWALADSLGRGFDQFGQLVKSGDFDRLLVRPRSTAFQVASRELYLQCGRLAQGAAVLGWACWSLGITGNASHFALLLLTVAGGCALFVGILIVQATLAFWTVESLEIMNTLTYGGVETAQYPLPIYQNWFRRFFTYAVPLGCVSYYPALALLERADPLGAPGWFGWVSPLIGFAFLAAAWRVWRFGVRHYMSTGS